MTWLSTIWPLDKPGHYLHWHFISLSVGNAVVIGLMVLVFVAALVLPFPGKSSRKGG
jgi:hypothetical protein